jgi:hypothetical protein
MRKASTPSLASLLLPATTISVRAENPQIAGIWSATLHGPCILMTVYDNEGELSGTMIFYLLKLENGSWHVKNRRPPSISFITA